MYFTELAIVAVIFYFINSSARKKEFRALAAQIRTLEKTIRDMTVRLAERQPDRTPDGVDAAVRADDKSGAYTWGGDTASADSAEGAGAVYNDAAAAMDAAENRLYTEPFAAGETEAPVPEAEQAVFTAQFEAAAEPESAEDVGFSFSDFSPQEDRARQEAGEETARAFAAEPHTARDDVPARESKEYFSTIMGFIRGGNLWVAGGVIMLLIGFAFLAQLGIFSVELRIAMAALTGMAMVGLGLYLRTRRRMYALIMQGGGIGVLYLSAFASAKLTTLLPPAAALAVMTALIIPAVALAVLQNAEVLALFGFVGGFAAPILLSDNSGNYIALFSCYTLLNLGILAICRYRLWRWLNFAGALCTFVVMGYWGVTDYEAAMFPTTEPFLIGFVLIYIIITLGSVRREMFSFAEPLDAILACGIPFVAALFQWRIAADIPHGLSISSVAFGAFFIALAYGVWRLWGERTRRLAEFYLANGVVLANLAVPLELSGNVTSTVWAVEGAMLFFFACRIKSTRIKIVALLLQVVGMVAFFWDVASVADHTLLSTSLISLAMLASACFQKLDADAPDRQGMEAFNRWLGDVRLETILAVWGLLWWYGGVALEAARFADRPLVMFFLVASVSSVVLFFAEKKTGLRELILAAVIVPLITAATCLLLATGGDFFARSSVAWQGLYHLDAWETVKLEARLFLRHNFLTGWSALAWAAFAVTQLGMLRLCTERIKPSRHAWWAGGVALELLFMLTSSGRGAALDFGLSRAWGHLASIVPALAYTVALTWMLKRYTEGRAGLFGADHARVLGGTVPAILFAPLGVWLFFSFFSLGKPAPLPFYVPVLNPLELKQALCIATFALWQRAISRVDGIRFVLPLPRLLLVLDALLFIWLHSMLFRAIALFTGTPMGRAWEHESFQVLLTVLWGVWGMSHLILGNRKRIRLIWVIGASLMLMDTAKLFLVDLADKGTLFRVLSFFVMGGIFLLIGWLAPLPPSQKTGEQAPDAPEPGPSSDGANDTTLKDDSNAAAH
ncbi:conserved membrane hypothetical protein [uncultured delta proteobacterium]|uniref:DUF2339 domain-containing protein n=1 Tax=uncultured delta proteobacterium TaxID=34034 RepID=A0A212J051_9DELT|nr:conserved membrane hypothetical protein [uncultured delta proteobacterium]